MNKFLVLLKKEIRELLTPQMFVPLILIVVAFSFVGKVINKESQKPAAKPGIVIIDNDNTAASQMIKNIFEKAGYQLSSSDGRTKDEIIKDTKIPDKSLLIIPSGFEAGLKSGQPQTLETYALVRSFSFVGARKSDLAPVIAVINDQVSSQVLAASFGDKAVTLKNPIKTEQFTVVKDKVAQVGIEQVVAFISSQATLVPIILFLVIAFAAGMIASSVAGEKENKTLETLLSAPIGRKSIVAAKLVSAGFIALLSTGVYLIGLKSFMNGVTGSIAGTQQAANSAAIAQLGLNMGPVDYGFLAVSLFLGILIALAIAMILGSFAKDTKSVQGLISPLMILVFIPYLLVFALDFDTLSNTAKYLIYLIPFSHSFLAVSHIMLRDYQFLLWGYLYLVILLFIFIYIAAKIFSSDKILTLNLDFRKRKKLPR
ncbi:MAG: ABC transporter permease [Acidobacteriaceae bacterium]